MSMGRARGVALIGMQGRIIDVEADIGQALPAFVLLGLPDAALRESQDRIRSAAKNTGIDLPARRLTVNLSPASLPKSGSGLDLAILVAAWAAQGHLVDTEQVVFLAELGLDGRLRPVPGVLPAVAAAAEAGTQRVVVAEENAAEAALVPGVEVLSAGHAVQVAAAFRAPDTQALPAEVTPVDRRQGGSVVTEQPEEAGGDLAEVRGQAEARWALEVAAAGGHHMMLVGPPGAGKTMLAERLPSILPPLDEDESMEVTAIDSISSGAASVTRLRRRRPFEAPHHSASAAAILGGGARLATPGAVTRAHHGVLFLDEAPEFARGVLDSLRQPLETGTITLHRSAGAVSYPAQFQLVLAANPCPCGMSSVGSGAECTCSVPQRRGYFARLSGPLLDRIDVQVTVERPRSAALARESTGESSAAVRARVEAARQAQAARLAPHGYRLNAQVPMSVLCGALKLPSGVVAELDAALDRALISLRGYVRVLRTAWTLADLCGDEHPTAEHIDAAMQLRAVAR
ncbi:YifB family Mg chelatase-like AAA ATPase [Nesterenkonia alba]|uniref:YifB family Mg chelatase-like AAA ATPase n=1 Tax=Nesterenkonia alba TaxID=515814 RepID=UPI0003B30E44|nr:YifB family Mg chelatase-like AAA ATPase [Nesterenkonia alba]